MTYRANAALEYVPTQLRWVTDESRGIAFGVPPKNGMHSIWFVLRGHDGVHRTTNPYKCQRRVFIVRHPIDRFTSLWKNKCRDGEQPGLGISGMNPEQLFEHIQANKSDHWDSQVAMLNGVDVEVVRLEDMGRWWFDYCGEEYPKYHATEGTITLSDDLTSKLLDHYAADLRLWHGI